MTYSIMDIFDYLKRQKKLGDYMIVGITADDFDNMRGKINVQLSLMERIEVVRATGLQIRSSWKNTRGQKNR